MKVRTRFISCIADFVFNCSKLAIRFIFLSWCYALILWFIVVVDDNMESTHEECKSPMHVIKESMATFCEEELKPK